MYQRYVATAAFLLFAFPALAEIEKIAFACGQQVCFRWWPKLQAVPNWGHDRDHSLHYNFNALAPVGTTFATAETVMYANAIYKARVPEEKSLPDFIEGDLQKFRVESPGLLVEAGKQLRTASGKTGESHLLKPTGNGQWERVAYFEEGDYYVVFVVSSRTESGLHKATPAFEALVSGYRE